MLVTSVGLTLYVVWALTVDEDDVTPRLSYYRGVALLCQRIARRFGEAGINAELEYHRVLEANRL